MDPGVEGGGNGVHPHIVAGLRRAGAIPVSCAAMLSRLSAIALVSATVFPVFVAAQESSVDPAEGRVAEDTSLAPLNADFFVPRDQLDVAELIGLPEYCAGAYRWPTLSYPLGVDDSGMVTTAEARAAQYLRSGEITLSGDVVIRRGNRTLRAAEVSLDRNTMIGRADAGVTIEEEDFIARGETGEINLNTSASQMINAEFLFKELNDKAIRGQADDVRQLENQDLQATRVNFTSCEPGNQTWQISARTMTIEHDEIFGHARDAVLRLGDVPVLYTPYISFPVSDERKSGWLFPTLAYSDVDGMDITLPYYLNLAENYDATISPSWIKDRGFGVETEFRTLSGWQETTISGAFLPKMTCMTAPTRKTTGMICSIRVWWRASSNPKIAGCWRWITEVGSVGCAPLSTTRRSVIRITSGIWAPHSRSPASVNSSDAAKR